ncbi:hypothetical protein Tco_0994212 [Tanacetum coccineum]
MYATYNIVEFSVHELNDLVQKLGYSAKVKLYYHFRKPDGDLDTGMHALGNDHDVRKLAKYVRLGNKMIEVYIEQERTTLHTYYTTHEDVDFCTPKCVIQEIEDDAMPEMQVTKLKHRKPVKGQLNKLDPTLCSFPISKAMDLENTQNNSLAKLPLLKQGEYETWRLRIESYIQLQDYALWEIIEEGNSFKPVARTTTNEDGTSTTTIHGAVTAEQKILKKNDLKARSILMMTLPSEHLLTFNKYKDAKSLFEAIEARFGGNEAIKKTQKILLKQMYETFNASSSESLDSIFNRLQKIRNKSDLGSISFDDLYNNFKIVKPEVKRSVISSTNSGSQNLAFHVSTGSTPVSTASTKNSTACLSDATVYAYLATQPKGSQVVHEDLEKIHEDDLDEMDLKWQLALLKSRNPRSQENRNRSQDSSRRTVNVEESSSKAMLAIDGTGFDWSYMADEEASTNFALMAFSDSELNKSESDLDSYKKGLSLVEEQLVFYKKNKSMLCDQIAVLKRDASFNESDINALKKQVERLKKEKEDNQFKIDNFENASKSLDQLIGNQISDNNKNGLGYNVVPPPLTGLFVL